MPRHVSAGGTDRPVAESKRLFVEEIAGGATVAEALRRVSRSQQTYELWRRNDRDFAQLVDDVRASRKGKPEGPISFPEFSEKYLGARVFPHMMNVVDLIEGREPSWVHPSMTYEKGERDLLIVNMPPEHSKTSSITINYATYRIAMDPNVRIIIVSKTHMMAKKMLFAIKTRLTSPQYAPMQAAFAPPGGFDAGSESWSQDMIYLTPDSRTSGEKDPTVTTLGVRGHIYGSRADLVIMDDVVDLSNSHEYEKQIEWLQAEVLSRISASGALLVVGTRLASKDLYSELRDESRYPDATSPWTYLAMPAVLEAEEDPKDWVTLWPKSNMPDLGARGADAEPDEDGLFRKWDGPALAKRRARTLPRVWALVYQQKQVADDGVFDPDAIRACVNGNRMAGLMPRGMVNCRPEGMDGLIVVAGLDPAMAGHTAAVCIGLDPVTQKRHVLDVWNKPAMTPDAIRQLFKDWTSKYGIAEWRVEKNAFQSMLTQDREVREYLAGHGAILREHFTGSNKADADFGVASLAMLFAGWQDKRNLIELPSTHGQESIKTLIEQLITWFPGAPKTQKTDIVMALWFAELACRDRVAAMTAYGRSHARNQFATRSDLQGRSTINLMDYEFRAVGA